MIILKPYYACVVRHCYQRLAPGVRTNYVVGFYSHTNVLEHIFYASAQ